jgi:carotenoid cleavage dioxygenase-like enzyme
MRRETIEWFAKVVGVQIQLLGDTTCFRTTLRFYELNDNMEVQTVQNYDIQGYAFIHDFGITEDSIILMVNATSLHLTDFLLGKQGIIHCIHSKKDKPLKVRCASNYRGSYNYTSAG